MHGILGYSWGEIASILAAISVTVSGVYWVVRHFVKRLREFIATGTLSLREQLKERNRQIEELSKSVDKGYEKARALEREVDEHDRILLMRGEQVKHGEMLKKEVNRHHDVLIEHEKRIENLESDKK